MMRSVRKGWVEHVAHVGKKEDACKVLVGENVGERSLGRPGCRWKINVKIRLQEVERGDGVLHSYGSGFRILASFCNHGDEIYDS